jgi:hypothetical protein
MMMEPAPSAKTVTVTEVPGESSLQKLLSEAHFYDAYRAPLSRATLTPVEIFLHAVKATPAWVMRLMSLRNLIVRQLGLKDVGSMRGATGKPARDYQVGDQLGIFSVLGNSENELLLGIDDRHLDVRVSILKPRGEDSQSYIVSTVVKVHNWLGHLYMCPVGRIHPLVVEALMRRAAL